MLKCIVFGVDKILFIAEYWTKELIFTFVVNVALTGEKFWYPFAYHNWWTKVKTSTQIWNNHLQMLNETCRSTLTYFTVSCSPSIANKRIDLANILITNSAGILRFEYKLLHSYLRVALCMYTMKPYEWKSEYIRNSFV